jgi:hypoxanthine phosphoribosyltransferase
MIPNHYKLLHSREEIAASVLRVGREITIWAKEVHGNTGDDVVAIPILRGAIFFFADLVRAVGASVEIAPARTWGYRPEVNGEPAENVKVDISGVPVKGRSLLLVDDICDSGRTLAKLSQQLLDAGASAVRSAVLVKRVVPKREFVPDWFCFLYDGPEWVVGYGMDDRDRWRNLPYISTITEKE